MASAVFAPLIGYLASAISIPAARGPMRIAAGLEVSRGRLSTDSIGAITCTFDGVNADSEIRVFLPDGTEAAGIENCADNQVLSWGVYPAGSANNTVTIRIIHPTYDIKEFSYLAAIGERSLPVQQEIDPWYRNPL